jgi:hypothetical protein
VGFFSLGLRVCIGALGARALFAPENEHYGCGAEKHGYKEENKQDIGHGSAPGTVRCTPSVGFNTEVKGKLRGRMNFLEQ